MPRSSTTFEKNHKKNINIKRRRLSDKYLYALAEHIPDFLKKLKDLADKGNDPVLAANIYHKFLDKALLLPKYSDVIEPKHEPHNINAIDLLNALNGRVPSEMLQIILDVIKELKESLPPIEDDEDNEEQESITLFEPEP